jgi:hypothetical protein
MPSSMVFIFIILRLVPMRLDRFFGQVFMRLSYYSTDSLLTIGLDTLLPGTDEEKATKLFKKKKTRVHMTGYRQGKSHPLH